MKQTVLFVLIVFLGVILRFWGLGTNPASLDWDEAALGYNAFSILETGRDEYGSVLPLSFRSFGDYKPPLYVYLSTVPVAWFGLNEYATRFPSALFGSIAVVITYFLMRELFSGKGKRFALLVTLFLAVSPWHLQFSRVAFEANVALTFFLSGMLFFLKGLKRGRYFMFSCISFVLAMYTYHSPRLLVPLFLFGACILFFRELFVKRTWVVLCAVVGFVLIIPFVRETLIGVSGARFGSVTIMNPNERLGESIVDIEYDQQKNDPLGKLVHNRRIVYAREVLAGYLDHFNFDFLFLTGDAPGRHHAVGMGMLYPWEFVFVVAGFYLLITNFIQKSRTGETGGSIIFLWWFIIAPVASSLTTGTPHAVRALFYLPSWQVFTGLGISALFYYLRTWKRVLLRISVWCIFLTVFVVGMYYYLHMYWVHSPIEYAKEWQYGYNEAVYAAGQYENEVNKIIVTYRYDQPYIFFLYYNRVDPAWYQKQWQGGEILRFTRNFGKYEFRNIDWPKESLEKGVLFVGTGTEIPPDAKGIAHEIYFPDGTVAFRIVKK